MVSNHAELKDTWDRVYEQFGAFWGLRPTSSLVSLLNNWKVPAGRALDFGCGTGRNAIYAASKGWMVTAVDFSGEAIRIAKKLTNGTLIARIKYTSSTELRHIEEYNLVMCCGVLHGYDKKEAAQICVALRKSLYPGGLFLTSFFCRCEDSQYLNNFQPIVCGTEKFMVWPHSWQDFANWVYPSTVQILKHGLSPEQHGYEGAHFHHVVHCVARIES